jgi:ComF family protein
METCLFCGNSFGSPKEHLKTLRFIIDPITHPWLDETDPELARLDGISRYLGLCLRCLAELPYIVVPKPIASVCTQDSSSLYSKHTARIKIIGPVSALEYIELGRDVITRVKFLKENRLRRLWKLLGLIALEQSWELAAPNNQIGAIIPVPGSGFGHWQRGFQPVTWLAKDLSKCLNIPMVDLFSHHGNQSQKLLTRSQRLSNQSSITIKNNLKCYYKKRVEKIIFGKEVLLVDDVVTTGSTLHHVSSLLEQWNPLAIRIITLVKD